MHAGPDGAAGAVVGFGTGSVGVGENKFDQCIYQGAGNEPSRFQETELLNLTHEEPFKRSGTEMTVWGLRSRPSDSIALNQLGHVPARTLFPSPMNEFR